MVRLVLVLGDQLSPQLSALQKADMKSDVVVMAEVMDETSYVPHHPKKIAFILAAMRKFAAELRQMGWRVAYTTLDDPLNTGSITGELIRQADAFSAAGVVYTEPGEWRLIEALDALPLRTHCLADDRYIARHSEFSQWAKGRKALRMEYFYREMRRKTGLLMDDGKPVGGKWNYDHDNRKPAPGALYYGGPQRFEPDAVVSEVLTIVQERFGQNFGDLHPFWFATDRSQAEAHFQQWLSQGLCYFGDFQDAMLEDESFLYHAVIGLYINVGLLDPLAVCQQVEDAYRKGDAPLNAAEGFIRQIIGWREYMRGIYFYEGPKYTARNDLGHTRDLPSLYWGGATKMNCLQQSVAQTSQEAYAHHIQRLMVLGNFALLAGVAPTQIHEWFLAVYADAFEWVEAPNVIGMSQFADGGIIASKPYVSSGNYIHKMSNYCKSCEYRVQDKTGADACPFNLLYWDFLNRHSVRFAGNPRMGNIYRVWERFSADKQAMILSEAADFLARLDAGEPV
ncbi:cryptochrome/photolyase family protein [Loktanella sp. S4079]|uniref:cryptochrome/photolyase family protein n=1 Tax=Loktanella sp. S4079 TaxID=579483 RepID=UPI0005FA5CEC|nr:cryptochrome/photolyase family protein [Loktanella sp. S4079]KJZ18338.1 deoxyribodipyrimidine photolyase [Loktanella sp. S4079]